ncbi:MAG: TonB-dependent receptor [Porticoccaceae bacterium]|nr:TonB-dependent receptor [Porticoccaceae bacterium]
MFTKKIKPLAALVTLGSAALFTSSAFAQLEEVIVTAQKRSQSINDVGMSIAALSGDQIKNQGLTSLEDISTAVPGLVFSPSTTNTPIFTLRGVGFNESSLGVYPSTSLYIDEAPLPFPTLAMHTAFDLERLEVLKGPQGTLFGQNSTAGAINFIAAKPTDTFEAGADLSYGRFNKVEANGFVSGPLSDKLLARFAFTSVNSDDWQYSVTRDDENGEEEYFAGRLLFDFQPTDDVRVNVNLNGWTDKSDPQAQQLAAVRPNVPSTVKPEQINAPLVPFTARAADWSPANVRIPEQGIAPYDGIQPYADREFMQGIVRLDVDLNEDMVFTWLTTYTDYTQQLATDGDGSAGVGFDLENIEGDVESFNTEVRLTGDVDKFNWIVGANYDSTDTFERQDLRYFHNSTYNAGNFWINHSAVDLDQEIESYAFFGNVEYSATDALTLRAGARYTDTTIDARNCGYSDPGGNVLELFSFLEQLIYEGVPIDQIDYNRPLGQCYTFNAAGETGNVFVDELSEDNTSWRVGLDYQFNEDILTYLNVSKGYKTGSYPALAAAQEVALYPVTQESNLSYEAGFKATLADGSVQLNGAAFYYDYKDKQVRGKILDPIFGILDALINVPESEIKGLEADITWQATDRLTLTATATWLDSEITEYAGTDILGNLNQDFSGDRLPFTPELSYTVGADYRIPLSTGAEIFFGGNLRGQDDVDAAIGGDRLSFNNEGVNRTAQQYPYLIDSYKILDLRMGWESPDQAWKVMLWGKNVLNEYYWTSVIPSSDTIARFAGRPVTYGVTVGYTY